MKQAEALLRAASKRAWLLRFAWLLPASLPAGSRGWLTEASCLLAWAERWLPLVTRQPESASRSLLGSVLQSRPQPLAQRVNFPLACWKQAFLGERSKKQATSNKQASKMRQANQSGRTASHARKKRHTLPLACLSLKQASVRLSGCCLLVPARRTRETERSGGSSNEREQSGTLDQSLAFCFVAWLASGGAALPAALRPSSRLLA